MPRGGAITFRDIAGKLSMLRIECAKCGRSGRYRMDRLIAEYGIDATLPDFQSKMTADCPRRIDFRFNDVCAARMPDLPKVV
jgi:hypothetical protein